MIVVKLHGRALAFDIRPSASLLNLEQSLMLARSRFERVKTRSRRWNCWICGECHTSHINLLKAFLPSAMLISAGTEPLRTRTVPSYVPRDSGALVCVPAKRKGKSLEFEFGRRVPWNPYLL